jgi:hypothetical protein
MNRSIAQFKLPNGSQKGQFSSWVHRCLIHEPQPSLLTTLLSQYLAIEGLTGIELRCSILVFTTTLILSAVLSPMPGYPVPSSILVALIRYTILVIHCSSYQTAFRASMRASLYNSFKQEAFFEWTHTAQLSMIGFGNNLSVLPPIETQGFSCEEAKLQQWLDTLLEDDQLLVRVLLDPRIDQCTKVLAYPSSAPPLTQHSRVSSRYWITNECHHDVENMLKAMGIVVERSATESDVVFSRMERKLVRLIQHNLGMYQGAQFEALSE